MGHVLMENKNCLVLDRRLIQATGTAEREVSLSMAAGIDTSRFLNSSPNIIVVIPACAGMTLDISLKLDGNQKKNMAKKKNVINVCPQVGQTIRIQC